MFDDMLKEPSPREKIDGAITALGNGRANRTGSGGVVWNCPKALAVFKIQRASVPDWKQ